jgi:hypothetical protein
MQLITIPPLRFSILRWFGPSAKTAQFPFRQKPVKEAGVGQVVLNTGKNAIKNIGKRFLRGADDAINPQQLDDAFHLGFQRESAMTNPNSPLRKSIMSAQNTLRNGRPQPLYNPANQYSQRIAIPQNMPDYEAVQRVFNTSQDYAKANRLPWRVSGVSYDPVPEKVKIPSGEEAWVKGYSDPNRGHIVLKASGDDPYEYSRAVARIHAAAHEPAHLMASPGTGFNPLQGVPSDLSYTSRLSHPIWTPPGAEKATGSAGLSEYLADSHGLYTLESALNGRIPYSPNAERHLQLIRDARSALPSKGQVYRSSAFDNVAAALQDPKLTPQQKAMLLGHLEYMSQNNTLVGGVGGKIHPFLQQEYQQGFDRMGRGLNNYGFWAD